jgi:hypothetical protein
LPVDLSQPIGAEQPLGRRGAAAHADKPVPAPHHAIASHQPLTDGERLAAVSTGNADLRQPSMKCCRRLDMVEQPFQPGRQWRVASLGLAALPAPRPVAAKASFNVLAQSGSERPFVARRRRQFRQCSAAAVIERPCQGITLGFRGAERCPCRRQTAF